LCHGFAGGAKKFVPEKKVDKKDSLNPLENQYYPAENSTYKFNSNRDLDNRNLVASYNKLATELKYLMDPKSIDEIDARRARTIMQDKIPHKMKNEITRINNENLAESFNLAFDKVMERVDSVCKEIGIPDNASIDLKERVRAALSAS
jgi:hypothetical protein